MDIKRTKEQLRTACQETIFYWNLCEGYYHYHSAQISKKADQENDASWLLFYHEKIYQAFLRQYSIRRNLVADEKNSDPKGLELLKTLQSIEFFKSLHDGKRDTIDKANEYLKSKTELVPYVNNDNKERGRRSTRSLLGKTAFLVNPAVYSLYDNLAKDALHKIVLELREDTDHAHYFPKKVMKKSLSENYEKFLDCSDTLITYLDKECEFSAIRVKSLIYFKDTHAGKYFAENDDCYKRRATDKFLWIMEHEKRNRPVNNEPISDFLNGMPNSESFTK